MKRILLVLAAGLAIACFQRCRIFGEKIAAPVKAYPTDPFSKTMVPSQKFRVDAEKDNVVSGEEGVTLVMPKGCFVDEHGVVENGKVDIELAEALKPSDMILSNLKTMSNGQPLVTGGMFYFNVTKDGKQLGINKALPVLVEVPTHNRLGGMQVYKGIRDTAGNMNWVDPKPIENYLETVDINSLNFLPEDFGWASKPFISAKREEADYKRAVDSLYYSLSESRKDGIPQLQKNRLPNETYYEEQVNATSQLTDELREIAGYDTNNTMRCYIKGIDWHWGVDPAMIKVIRSEKFQNTFIATKAFESRLQAIFLSGENRVLQVYIDNIEKNLYEVDSMAAGIIATTREYKSEVAKTNCGRYRGLYNVFGQFANERLTKVKEGDRYSAILKQYYSEQLTKVKQELEKDRQLIIQQRKKLDSAQRKVYEGYRALLAKREKFRMETYGFKMTETGWVNIDNGEIPKNWSRQQLQVKITDGGKFDRVHAYVFYQSIGSMYRLNSDNNIEFYVGNANDRSMLMPNNSMACLFVIGHIGDKVAYDMQSFTTGKLMLTALLRDTTMEGIKAILPEMSYGEENDISKDLEYQYAMYSLMPEEDRSHISQHDIDHLIVSVFSGARSCEPRL